MIKNFIQLMVIIKINKDVIENAKPYTRKTY